MNMSTLALAEKEISKAVMFGLLGLCLLGCDNKLINDDLEVHKKIPYDFLFMQRAYPTGNINSMASRKALTWKRGLKEKQFSSALDWEFAGPVNVGGRVTDIEISFDAASIYYLGSASGGIFKTEDAGLNWSPIFDEQGSLSIGDIELSKTDSDIIWVGTGEANAGGGSLAYDGDGIYSSEDAGHTWTNKGLSDVGSISKILIDPNNGSVIYAATLGALFKNDNKRGVYKSVNNGATWEQVLFVSDSTGIIDMAQHPTNSDILYAAAWERVRRPQYRKYGGPTSGIYRSMNGGATWEELSNGLPTSADDKGRISISIAPSNPSVLYTRYTDAIGNIKGVYRTSNGGNSWDEVNSSQLNDVGFHWWFSGIKVDPLDENIIYNVDFIVEKSIDGGQNWTVAFPGVHVDQHALAFNTQNDNEILLGNDGGLYKSLDKGNSSNKYLNLPITQFYRFYVDPQNGNKIYGGSQDNSTIRTVTGDLNNWSRIYSGDGFQALVDANNTNVIYALSQYGNLGKSTNNGTSFSNATSGISNADRNNWDTPVVFDPQDSETLYYGTQRVWKTNNGAGSWSAISPDLTNGPGGGNLNFGTITTIDVSPMLGDFVVVGTDDSNIWVTQDGGENWNNVSSSLPNLWTTKVLADRDDVSSIYVTFSGYRYGENLGHVFKSIDAGNTWTAIGSELPDIPVNDIVKDVYGNLYIATDVGVFASINDGEDWLPFGDNMPSAVVTDLHIQESEDLLYAATYGRSAYKINISDNILSVANSDLNNELSVYPNPIGVNMILHLSERTSGALYSTNGKKIFSFQEQINLNMNSLKAGMYLLKTNLGSRRVIVL